MKNQLTLFAMTKKGHAACRILLTRFPDLVSAVVCSRDAGIANDYYDEISVLCMQHGVAFHDRKDFGCAQTPFSLAVSWRWMIPQQQSLSKLIILHDSLLPRLRGFNPLVTALINGDEEIGVTALYATEKFDRGDIIFSSMARVSYPVTIEDAINRISDNYENLAEKIGAALASGEELSGYPQDESAATYSLWRDEDDYSVDWSASATTLRRFVDAVGFPYKGASSVLDGKVVRILRVTEVADVPIENRVSGKVMSIESGRPIVVCGRGLLRIEELIDDHSGESLLPFKQLRLRFKAAR